jgi:hypothetical protein
MDSININELHKENIGQLISETERLFDVNILSKCSEFIMRKFIKISINLIKYFHQPLSVELSKYKTTYENVSNVLKDLEDILDNLFDSIVHLSDESIQICNYFHEEESENESNNMGRSGRM